MQAAIIGGGITGLTTALALHKKGIQSTVYEQAKELSEIGAGVWLQPNAVQVLDWLGIKEKVLARGMELDRMEIANHHLRPFKEIKEHVVQDTNGNKTIAIHRGRLQAVLYKEVAKVCEVHLGKRYFQHESTDDGITIHFSDGQAKADIVLGADGIHSNVRKELFPHSTQRNAHQVCWRGIATMSLPEDQERFGREAWGKGIRFGYSQISESEVYWFGVAKEASLNGTNPQNVKAYLKDRFANFHETVLEVIHHTPDNQIHEGLLGDLNRLDKWHEGNICLIGDAAHGTTPNMGQGACQGMEDAYYISQILAKHSTPTAAFEAFTSVRRKKVDYVVNNSWRFGKMAHSSLGQSMMKLIMKLTPEKVLSDQMNKLYELEAV